MRSKIEYVCTVLAALTLVSCDEPATKDGQTDAYLRWYVAHQSGEPDLAERLVDDFRRGWNTTRDLTAANRPAAEIVKELRAAGHSAFLIPRGESRQELPGRTASFLVMDRDNGCHQITRERWVTKEVGRPTSLALIGMGREDVSGEKQVEKQLHLMAVELPKEEEFVELRTGSFSPLVKGIVVFGTVLLTTGCDTEREEAEVPALPESLRCKCNITVNHAPGTRSRYEYFSSPTPGGRDVYDTVPLGWQTFDHNSNPPSGLGRTVGRNVEYIVEIERGYCEVRQYSRLTFTKKEPGTTNIIEVRRPEPTPFDAGGHESSIWDFEGEPSPLAHRGPLSAYPRYVSWIELSRTNIIDSIVERPVRRIEERLIHVVDQTNGRAACITGPWSMTWGIDEDGNWDPAPSDTLGGPYQVDVPAFR